MSYFAYIAYPLYVIAALELLLGFLLLRQRAQNAGVIRSVAALSIFASAYALCTAVMYHRAELGFDYAVLARANWIGWLCIPAAIQFVYYVKGSDAAARRAGWWLYPFWTGVLLLSLFTDLIVTDRYELMPYFNEPGPLEKPARLLGAAMIVWFMYEIIRLRWRVTGFRRIQLNYFLVGIFIFGGGAVVAAGFLQLFGGLGFEPGLGSFFGFPWVVLTFYAIARYSLFDLRAMASRSLGIIVLIVLFSGLQAFLFDLLEPTIGPIFAMTVSLAIVGLLLFGTPFSSGLQRLLNSLIIKDRTDYQNMLHESTTALVTILQLDDLLRFLIKVLSQGFGVSTVCLYLKGPDGGYSLRQSHGAHAPSGSGGLAESVIHSVQRTGGPIISALPDRHASGEELQELTAFLMERSADVVIPLFYKGTLQGAFTLGSKSNGRPYTQRDLDLLQTLAGQAAVAIENARLFEEAHTVRLSLQESEDKFKTLARTIPIAILIHQGASLLYANPAAEVLSGYGADELQTMTLLDLTHPDHRAMVRDRSIGRIAWQQAAAVHELRLVKKDGEERSVVMSSGVIELGGRQAVIDALADITDRINLEGKFRYAQKMEAIGKLAGGVAHDFNNVLSVIVGHGGILQAMMQPSDPLRHHVDQILASSERAANLTRSLLVLKSKPETALRPTNLRALTEQVEKFLAGLLREGITLRIAAGSEPLPILGDAAQLERVYMNLAVNARDAMPQGGVITISAGSMEMDGAFIRMHGFGKIGRYATILVADTGVGMDEQVKAKIFEPFFTTKSAGKGTGFGLSIVYDIVKDHNGYISVASEPGKGTTFTVYIPLEAAGGIPAPPVAEAVAPAPTRDTILVVDDDDTVRGYVATVLEAEGYTVLTASDGEAAIKSVMERQNGVKLILLDVIMPRVNGREVYTAVKKIRPDIKVLFTSGYSAEILRSSGVLAHNHPFLLKPASQRDILARTREVLGA